jgi:hypothetical protein
LVGGAFSEAAKQLAGLGQVPDAVVELGEVLMDELGDVAARGLAVIGDCQHLSDLCECEPGGLGVGG